MRTSGTTVSATGHKGGLGDGLYDKAGARPDLDLDFARTKSLKDRVSKEDLITFTRSSGVGKGATYVDENGLVKVAPINAVVNSEDLTHATYNFSTADKGVLSANAGTSPNGGVAGALVGQGLTGRHTVGIRPAAVNNSYLLANNTRYVMSVFVKRLSGDINDRYVNLETAIYSSYTYTGTSGVFDLETGTRITNPSGTGAAYITSGIEDVGDGWYRIHFSSVTGTAVNNTGVYLNVVGDTGATGSVTLSSSQGILVWGAQVEYGSVPTTYIPTNGLPSGAPRFTHDPVTKESKGLLIEQAVTNLTYPSVPNQDGSGSGLWNGERTSRTYNAATAPDGTNTAMLFTQDTADGTHVARANHMATLTDDTDYTFSCFVKKPPTNGNRYVWIALHGRGYRHYDLQDGVLATATGDGTATNLHGSITAYPNDWYKLTYTINTSSNNSVAGRVYVGHSTNGTTHSFTGDGITGLLVWGTQLEEGAIATSYIPTSATSTVTRSPDLVSIEGDNFGTYRKNLLRYTVPKKHIFVNNFYSLGEGSLTDYADIAPDGTYSATLYTENTVNAQHLLRWQATETFDATTDYTWSCYLKNPATNGSRYAIMTQYGGTYVVFDLQTGTLLKTYNNLDRLVGTSITPVGNEWYRCSMTMTSTSSPVQRVYVGTHAGGDANVNSGHSFTGDGVSGILIWGAQVEKSSTMTEYIPSTDTYTNRQSNATFVDGNGIIKFSYANLLKYSEQLDHSDWSKQGNVSITADNVVAPDGTTTADTPNFDSAKWGFYNSTTNPGNWLTGYYQGTEYPFLNSLTSEWVRYNVSITTESGQSQLRVYPLRRADGMRYIYQSVTVEENTTYVFSAWYKKVGTKVYVWGCQLVKGTEAGDYYKTTGTISGPPRYSHDPETLTPTGLYLEPEATNLLRHSNNPTNGVWFKSNASVLSETTTGPDLSSVPWIEITDYISQDKPSPSSGTTYTTSIWLKAETACTINFRSMYTPNINTDINVTTEWKRFSITGTYGSSHLRCMLDNRNNTTATTVKIALWGAQIETGSVATSTIETTSAANGVTRTADTFTSTATEVLDRANGTKPAFYTKNGLTTFTNGIVTRDSVARRFFEFGTPATTTTLATSNTGTRAGIYQPNPSGSSAGASAPGVNLSADGNKIAVRYATNNLRVCTDGTLGNLDTDIDVRSPTTLFLGRWYVSGNNSEDDRQLQGTINRLTIWKTPFVDSKLQRITS
jgi:hypothetical protein